MKMGFLWLSSQVADVDISLGNEKSAEKRSSLCGQLIRCACVQELLGEIISYRKSHVTSSLMQVLFKGYNAEDTIISCFCWNSDIQCSFQDVCYSKISKNTKSNLSAVRLYSKLRDGIMIETCEQLKLTHCPAEGRIDLFHSHEPLQCLCLYYS